MGRTKRSTFSTAQKRSPEAPRQKDKISRKNISCRKWLFSHMSINCRRANWQGTFFHRFQCKFVEDRVSDEMLCKSEITVHAWAGWPSKNTSTVTKTSMHMRIHSNIHLFVFTHAPNAWRRTSSMFKVGRRVCDLVCVCLWRKLRAECQAGLH